MINVCKVLDLTPAIALSSWGTIHFPEEGRLIEFAVNVRGGKWKWLRYGPCIAAPEGGFLEIKAAHEEYLAAFDDLDEKFKAQMICKEGITVDQVVRLVLGELQKVDFPHSLTEEASMLRKRLETCARPPSRKMSKRFEVE